MLYTKFLIARIRFHSYIARRIPSKAAHLVDSMVLDLLSISRKAVPIPIKDSSLGVPWLGEARCEDMNCGYRWNVFAPNGVDPEINLECPECGNESGVLV